MTVGGAALLSGSNICQELLSIVDSQRGVGVLVRVVSMQFKGAICRPLILRCARAVMSRVHSSLVAYGGVIAWHATESTKMVM